GLDAFFARRGRRHFARPAAAQPFAPLLRGHAVPQRAQSFLFGGRQGAQRAEAFAHRLALLRRQLAEIAPAFAQPFLLVRTEVLPALPAAQDLGAPLGRHAVPIAFEPAQVRLL